MDMKAQALTRRLSQLHASPIHDVLREIGCKNFVLPNNIKPLKANSKISGSGLYYRGRNY
jgi:hypothetical protein